MRAGCGAEPGVCVCCYRGMEQILWLLPKHRQPVLVRYGVSAAIILVCCAVQYAIYRVAGFAGLFLLLPGIFVAGILFDRGSAFFATALGALVSIYLMFPAWPALDAPVVVPIVLFLLTGVAMAIVSEGLRMALERIVKAEREKDLLLRELRHRTKNDIMNIGSILRLQSRRASAEEGSNAHGGAAQRVEARAQRPGQGRGPRFSPRTAGHSGNGLLAGPAVAPPGRFAARRASGRHPGGGGQCGTFRHDGRAHWHHRQRARHQLPEVRLSRRPGWHHRGEAASRRRDPARGRG